MATRNLHRSLEAFQINDRLNTVSTLVSLTQALRDHLDEALAALRQEESELSAAFKLRTFSSCGDMRLPERLGVTKEQLTRSELAVALGVNRKTVIAIEEDGRLPKPRRVERRLLFSRSEINQWSSPKLATVTDAVSQPMSGVMTHDD